MAFLFHNFKEKTILAISKNRSVKYVIRGSILLNCHLLNIIHWFWLRWYSLCFYVEIESGKGYRERITASSALPRTSVRRGESAPVPAAGVHPRVIESSLHHAFIELKSRKLHEPPDRF